MTVFFQQLINGLSLGSIYALIALGYTMVYGIIKLINFAHGDIYMLGAYIGFMAITVLGVGFFPAPVSYTHLGGTMDSNLYQSYKAGKISLEDCLRCCENIDQMKKRIGE